MLPSKIITLVLFISAHPNLEAKKVKARVKRALPPNVAKTGAALVAPLVAKGLKGALGMSRDTFDAYRLAAQKESSSGGWLTSKFVDLMYLPTINLLTNQIRNLEEKMRNQHDERDDYFVIIVCLTAAVPTLLVSLCLVCLINFRRVSRIRENLFEHGRSIEILSTAAASRCGPAVRGAGQAQPGGAGSSGNPTGPVINFRSSAEQ